MKAVILAGGLGTRLGEETTLRPKPMITIGNRPILWHIMKIYSSYGIRDFIICLGYKGYVIKEYFANYLLHSSDVTVDMYHNKMEFSAHQEDPWRVTLVDTGENTATGGRLKRLSDHLQGETFCFTYGDGLADININALLDYHKQYNRLATITAVRPPARFGALSTQGERVVGFKEKPTDEGGWINGGFFILSPAVLDYISDDDMPWESSPLEHLAQDNQLSAFFHEGFWHPMDTLRDKHYLEQLWDTHQAPWKIW